MRMRASWFGSLRPTGYKVAARVPRAPTASSPRTCHPDHNQRAAVLGAVKAGLETTERAARPERRPTLTAPARAGLHGARRGLLRVACAPLRRSGPWRLGDRPDRTGLRGNATGLWTVPFRNSDIKNSSSRDWGRNSRPSVRDVRYSSPETGPFTANPRECGS